MTEGLIIWFAMGMVAWGAICFYFGTFTVGDAIFAVMSGVTGPLLPMLIGVWWFALRLQVWGRIVIWQRKPKVKK